jgi:uncharacterized membrane protein (DUF373 family)
MNLTNIILKVHKSFEKIIVLVLLVLLMIVVGFSVYEMIVVMIQSIWTNDNGSIVTLNELHNIFGTFLMVLIGIKLMQTIKVYLDDKEIHVEIVFIVAMIAVAQHVIVLNFSKIELLEVFGISSLIISLTVGFYFIKKSLILDNFSLNQHGCAEKQEMKNVKSNG